MRTGTRTHTSPIVKITAVALITGIAFVSVLSFNTNFKQLSGAFNAAVDYIKNNRSDNKSKTDAGILLHGANTPAINNGELMLYVPALSQPPISEPPPVTESTESTEPPASAETEPAAITETPPPEPITEPNPVISQNISAEREDFSVFTKKDGTVIQTTYHPRLNEGLIHLDKGGQVNNKTDIDDSLLLAESRKPLPFKIERGSAEPQVLIIHSHTTESYRTSIEEVFDKTYSFRSVDSQKNIVAVGAAIAENIAKEGITVIHDGTVHDKPYTSSYKRSAETVSAILKEYPSIKVVLDIHRDAIEDNGSPIAPVAVINGKEAAQVMIIAAADDGEWGVPDFMKNFRFAASLQSQSESDNAGLMRAILFQYCNYNMHLSTGSLLIEIGSHGNTLEQAVYAGELLGASIGKFLIENAE